ncbi:MerR family transcriptional regulator, partial [Catellatospora methionotrophica]|uniref:MerR family transcriptional regulator n=1 Tax=Catellatospora methionotrophica TaxID=121620 RepID=UPI0033D0E0A8
MGLLTIGAFARAAGLSAKALRLYDDLGLLPPAAVDAETGYRFYEPDQLERARLIAALRRLDMPLARIRLICGLPPAAAAAEIGRFWDEVTADTAAREQLAARLVGQLSAAPDSSSPRRDLRAAARSEAGLVRDSQEDVAYAGTRLLAVADGMRGQAGARAASAAVAALRHLDAATSAPDRVADVPVAGLGAAFADADAAVRTVAER